MADPPALTAQVRLVASARPAGPGPSWDFDLDLAGGPGDRHWDVVLTGQSTEDLAGIVGATVAEGCLRVTQLGLSAAAVARRADILLPELLCQLAAGHGCTQVEFRYRRSGHDNPAAEFLRRIASGSRRPTGDGIVLTVPAAAGSTTASADPPCGGCANVAIDVPALVGARWRQLGPRRRAEVNVAAARDWPDPQRLAAAARGADAGSGLGQTARQLAEIWQQLLGQDAIGPNSNFFELGGHSLLATRLVARVNHVFGIDLDIGAVFERPTLARLAAEVLGAGLAAGPGTGRQARPALAAAARPERVPLSFAQWRLWFLQQLEGPSAIYNIPMAIRLSGIVDTGALQAALADVADRHESLRTVFPDLDGKPYQLVLAGDRALPVLEVVRADRAQLPLGLEAAAGYCFDVTAEPPVRAWLFRAGQEEHVLLVVVHHICCDGWSLGPLSRDLSRAYEARRGGAAPDWDPLPVQYADYALWQLEMLGRDDDPQALGARQVEFWKIALAGLPQELALPYDRPRPTAASFLGGTVPFAVPPVPHAALTGLARECGASLFMVVQTAVAVLLSCLGAGPDIPVGSPVAGRSDPALDGLIGFFVNTLVLRTDVSGDPTFRELVRRTADADLAAFAHQDIPFERLVERLNPVRSMARHPLFQVALTVADGTVAPLPQLPGLVCAIEPVGLSIAKFDLSFGLTERHEAAGAPAGLDGELEFAADLFDRSTAEAVAAGLVQVLEAVAANPEVHCGQIEMPAALLLEGKATAGNANRA